MGDRMLAMQNVSFSYDRKEKTDILQNVSVTFERGKMYVLYGKSGSGKTTMLKLLSGLLQPAEGKIIYDGKKIENMGATYRNENVSIIFQDYCLPPYMTAIENVQLALGIQKKKISDNEVIKYLNRFGISEKESRRKTAKLSGGQQQRVAIIRALMMQTEYILADEPTSNLDEDNENEIIAFLKALAHEQNKGIIVASHSKEMYDAADICFRVRKGNVLEETL